VQHLPPAGPHEEEEVVVLGEEEDTDGDIVVVEQQVQEQEQQQEQQDQVQQQQAWQDQVAELTATAEAATTFYHAKIGYKNARKKAKKVGTKGWEAENLLGEGREEDTEQQHEDQEVEALWQFQTEFAIKESASTNEDCMMCYSGNAAFVPRGCDHTESRGCESCLGMVVRASEKVPQPTEVPSCFFRGL
jgi:hypothetical protein